GLLQPMHFRRGICNDRGSFRAEHDCFRRIIDPNGSWVSLLGPKFEDAVLQILVFDLPVIQERGGGARRPGLLLNERKSQCGKRQHADAAAPAAAANACNRRVDREATSRRYLADQETEGSANETDQRGAQVPSRIADKALQLHAGTARDDESRAIDK